MANLTIPQIQSVLAQAGWSASLIPIMAAVSMGESSGNPSALNDRGEYSVGLFQINLNAHGTRYGTAAQLQDPVTNARAALAIYNERGGGERGLKAWGAYGNGSYQRWLAQSQAAFTGAAGSVSDFFNQYGDQTTSGFIGIFLLGFGGLILMRYLKG